MKPWIFIFCGSFLMLIGGIGTTYGWQQDSWFFIIVGGISVVIGGLFINYGWHRMGQEKRMSKDEKTKLDDIAVSQIADETLENVKGVSIVNPQNDMEAGKINVVQQAKNIKDSTGMELKFDEGSGEVELKDKVHVEQKTPQGTSSVTFNADQPGVTIKFNTKPDK